MYVCEAIRIENTLSDENQFLDGFIQLSKHREVVRQLLPDITAEQRAFHVQRARTKLKTLEH